MTAAAGQLAKSKSVLGVLPLGTGNSFALSLGIADLAAAVDAIAAGREVAVDLGRVNGTYFANFATIGLSSTIARATPSRLKKLIGAAAYVLAGVLPGLRSRPFRCSVQHGQGEARVSHLSGDRCQRTLFRPHAVNAGSIAQQRQANVLFHHRRDDRGRRQDVRVDPARIGKGCCRTRTSSMRRNWSWGRARARSSPSTASRAVRRRRASGWSRARAA